MWTNSFQQLADGLTKVSARQFMADSLRRGTHALKYDPEFTAGKKVNAKDRAKIANELDGRAATMEALAVDLANDDEKKCVLEGCGKPVQKGHCPKSGKPFEACCRRHWYSHNAARNTPAKQQARAAARIVAKVVLAANLVQEADAYGELSLTTPQAVNVLARLLRIVEDPDVYFVFQLMTGICIYAMGTTLLLTAAIHKLYYERALIHKLHYDKDTLLIDAEAQTEVQKTPKQSKRTTIYLSSHGECYHDDERCKAILGRVTTTRRPCRMCTA